MGEALITKIELINKNMIELVNGMSQNLLSALKDKGAPVMGTLLLAPDLENYIWYHCVDVYGAHCIQWKNKKETK